MHILLIVILLSRAVQTPHALPLSTNSRWIVDEEEERVKLACVNWVSHLEIVVTEGLSKQPIDSISNKIIEMGFNCVRLTWAIYLVTNDTLANLSVRQSFLNYGLNDDINGFEANNPSFLNLSLINAFQVFYVDLLIFMFLLNNSIILS